MTESFDADDNRGAVDIRKTLVRKFQRNSEIEAELERNIRIGNRRFGKRPLGRTDLTDVPSGFASKVMPLPYFCPNCGMKMLAYFTKCNLCKTTTPLGKVNWRR